MPDMRIHYRSPMPDANPAGSEPDNMGFLRDALWPKPSPVLLIAADEPLAKSVAHEIFDGRAKWNAAPQARGRFLIIDYPKLAAMDAASAAALLSNFQGTDHWIYLAQVQYATASAEGRRLFGQLLDMVGAGDVRAVIATIAPEDLDQMRRRTPRLSGFASILRGADSNVGASYSSPTRYLAVPATAPTDTGWLVMVRYDLTSPLGEDRSDPDPLARQALALVDKLQVIDIPGEPPRGALISLLPDAFTVSQGERAFSVAGRAAAWAVGRVLGHGESVHPGRGLYFSERR